MSLIDEKIPEFTNKNVGKADRPALTADEVKSFLDENPEILRTGVNSMIDQIIAEYATKTELADVTAGVIPDNSITEQKLAFDVATQAELDVVDGKADDNASNFSSHASNTSLHLSLLTLQGQIPVRGASQVEALSIGSPLYNLEVNAGGTTLNYQPSIKNILNSTGAIPYATSPNNIGAVSIGSEGQILRAEGNVPTWGNEIRTVSVSGNDTSTSMTGGAQFTKTIPLGQSCKWAIVSVCGSRSPNNDIWFVTDSLQFPITISRFRGNSSIGSYTEVLYGSGGYGQVINPQYYLNFVPEGATTHSSPIIRLNGQNLTFKITPAGTTNLYLLYDILGMY